MFLRVFLFNILLYFSILFFGIIFLPFIFSRKIITEVVRIWARIIIASLKVIVGIEVKFNDKYVKNKSGIIVAANHQSAFDTIFFLAAFEKTIYIIKKELIFIPIYGWYAIRLGNIFIDREKRIESVKKLSKSVKKMIDRDYNVIIFPEGTRHTSGKIGNLKPGVFLLQNAVKKPIYPIFINSGYAWPKNSLNMKKENILIKSLKPIPYGLQKKSFKKTLEDRLKKTNEEYNS